MRARHALADAPVACAVAEHAAGLKRLGRRVRQPQELAELVAYIGLTIDEGFAVGAEPAAALAPGGVVGAPLVEAAGELCEHFDGQLLDGDVMVRLVGVGDVEHDGEVAWR
jgi:hypothetical protein